jgi:hypothetical protein
MTIWSNGQAIIVTTHGPGRLHLLSYQNNARGLNTVGGIRTTSNDTTRFLISFSHHYERFAFYWDGAGAASYAIGASPDRKPVGRSWQQACYVPWGASTVSTADVGTIASSALNRDNVTTCFIIPDLL